MRGYCCCAQIQHVVSVCFVVLSVDIFLISCSPGVYVPWRQVPSIMNVGARNCRNLLSLQRSYQGLTRRTSLRSLRPRRGRGLQLVAACCCHTTAARAAVSCSPEQPHYRGNKGIGSNVGYQIPSVGASVWEKLARTLRRIARALQLLLRTLGIGLLFSTPVVSGSIVYVLHRLPGFPLGVSTQLCDWWWRLFLNVIDRSGPTFIKVLYFSIPRSTEGTQRVEVCRQRAGELIARDTAVLSSIRKIACLG